ncbi:MAG: hypothetical protein VB070_12745 [Clostridiaceae bacterium]|nr:hypothetical protein [Clostridiaceae bacterium]
MLMQTLRPLWKSTAGLAWLIVLTAFLLELFVFNAQAYALVGRSVQTAVISPENYTLSGFTADPDDAARLIPDAQTEHAVEITGLDQKVCTIWLPLVQSKREVVSCKVYATDAAAAGYYRILENHQISSDIPSSWSILLHTNGASSRIKLVFDLTADQSIRVPQIEINRPIALQFSWLRFILAALVGLVILFLRRSAVCRLPRQLKNTLQNQCMAILILFVLIISILLATLSQGNLMVSFKESDGDIYSRDLVNALAAGQLSLLTEPPQELVNLDNPYDPNQRAAANIKGVLWDAAYFKGHYYIYFGLVPALFLLLPFHLLTGLYLPSVWLVILAAVIGQIMLIRLLDRFLVHFFPKLPFRFHLLSGLALAAGSNLWWCLGRPKFYEVAITGGLCLGVSGLYLLFRAWQYHQEGRLAAGRLIFGCLLLALAVGTRPNLLFLSLLPIPFFIRLLRQPGLSCRRKPPRRLFGPAWLKPLLCIALPYLTVGLSLMVYNAARFGSFTEFGARYQLTVTDMNSRGMFSPVRIIPGIWYYLFNVPIINTSFPFIHFQTDPAFQYSGYFYTDGRCSGLLAVLPVCWILAAWPVLRRYMRDNLRPVLRLVKGLTGVSLMLVCLNSMAAGSTGRYQTDFAWLLVAAAILIAAVWITRRQEMAAATVSLSGGPGEPAESPVLSYFGLLAGLTLLAALLLAIQGENDLFRARNPVIFLRLTRFIAFWLP